MFFFFLLKLFNSGSSLKQSNQLPDFVLDIKTPSGIGQLASEFKQSSVYELEGELEGLKHIDLDKEGLSEYRSQLTRLGLISDSSASSASGLTTTCDTSSAVSATTSSALVQQIFRQLDSGGFNSITINEANSIFLRINSRLGRHCTDKEVNKFFNKLKFNIYDCIDLVEFRRAFDEFF